MGNIYYNMEKLSKVNDTNALKAEKKFGSRQDYFDKLTDFIEEFRKFLLTYNPMVVIHSVDMRNEFTSVLTEIRKTLKLLEIYFFDFDLEYLEKSALGGSPNIMQDELTKLIAKADIFAKNIELTRTDVQEPVKARKVQKYGVKYDMNRLSQVSEFEALKAVKNFDAQQDYFDNLTEFTKNTYKLLCSFNPTVVVFGDEVRNEFMGCFNEIKNAVEFLKILTVGCEMKNILSAINNQDVKQLSDELLMFNSKLAIIAMGINSASAPEEVPVQPAVQYAEETVHDGIKYDMNELVKFDEFNALKASKKFKTHQAYFNKLTEFSENAAKFLNSYNPTVVIYSEDVRNSFLSGLKNIKNMLAMLEMNFVDSEINSLEKAIRESDVKTLSVELTKFSAKMEIVALRVATARASKRGAQNNCQRQRVSKGCRAFLNEINRFLDNTKQFLKEYNTGSVEIDDAARNNISSKMNEVRNAIALLEDGALIGKK